MVPQFLMESSNPQLALLVAVILPLLLLFVLLGRPRHRHSHPPGPWGWPVLGNLPQLGAKPHQTLAALARVYGPLFRLRFGSVNVVVAANASTASLFLKTHDTNFSNRPPNASGEHVAYNYHDMVFAPYGPRWRMLRKLCNVHLFSAMALEKFQQVRSDEVSMLVRNLGEGGTVNLGREVNVCATNALGRVVLGRRLFVRGKEAEEFKDMVEELMRLAGEFNLGDFVPWLKWLDLQGVVGKLKRLHKRYDVLLNRFIAESERKSDGGCVAEGSLLSVLVGLKDKDNVDGEGGRITDVEIKALFQNLFIAGTDTTYSTVEWAVAELIRHPDILRKVQQEMDTVVGRDRLVSEGDMSQLPYLLAVVKEALRLHPPTPLAIPHMAIEDCVVGGYYVAKNTTLLVNVWAISHDPDTWADPLEFRPGRFLPGGERPGADIRGNDFEVIPFGAGRRICAGMSLGLKMVQLLVAMLTHAFDWELADGQRNENLDMEEAYGLTLQRAVPLIVQPIKRLHPDIYA